jgi:hypothetical protein
MRLENVLQGERASHLGFAGHGHRPRSGLELPGSLGWVGLFCAEFVEVVVSRYIFKGIGSFLQAHSSIFLMLERYGLRRVRGERADGTRRRETRDELAPVVIPIGRRDFGGAGSKGGLDSTHAASTFGTAFSLIVFYELIDVLSRAVRRKSPAFSWDRTGNTARTSRPLDLVEERGPFEHERAGAQMGSIGRSLISSACALCVASVAAHAEPPSAPSAHRTVAASPGPPQETEHFFGPLRVRDLTPFGYLRLDMRPTFGDRLAPGAWAFETEIAYQNTWALSPPVRRYLSKLAGTPNPGRKRVCRHTGAAWR